MYVTIGMIVLNEAECIGRNLRQHYALADKIVIVEGADRLYPRSRVTIRGLSTDGTAEIIRRFMDESDPEQKIVFIRHGWAAREGDQAKCELRNRYAELAPDGLLCVIDADEAYQQADFAAIVKRARERKEEWAWEYPFIHFWHHTGLHVTGGYYDVGHIRFWRWRKGMRYVRNHNFPESSGRFGHELGAKFKHKRRIMPGGMVLPPACYHFGFCKQAASMRDKTDYYRNRGECSTRPKTIASREAWFEFAGEGVGGQGGGAQCGQGGELNTAGVGLKLWKYDGTLPEQFRDFAPPPILPSASPSAPAPLAAPATHARP